jgi:hypothetical protein
MEAIMMENRAAHPDPLAPTADKVQVQKAAEEQQMKTRKTNNQIKALIRGANCRTRK